MITDKMRELRKEKIMYEITITQKTIKKVPSGKSWEIIKEVLYTDEEIGEASGFYKESRKTMPSKCVYGYTPKIIKEEHVDVELLKQTVKDLDLTAVIKVINGIE